MVDKEQAKKEYKKILKMILICIIVFSVAVIIFSVSIWFLKKLVTKEDDKDPKNAPAAARSFMNDTNIDENGNITLGKSISEWWEELKKNGNKITTYLNSPEELAKIMNAAMALDYPDTRKNPDAPIDWSKIGIDSTKIQGIVKFKRALANGKSTTMTYVSPSKFQELINKYKATGKESDKQEALKHFTVEKTYSANGSTNTGGSPLVEETLKYACSWVGKISYQLSAGDKLVDGGKSDCSHFIHRVFGHVGLMEDTLEYFDKYGHSLTWGLGGDAGGCPGTVKIGTDLTQASPGDVIWWHFGSGSNNHVAIYLGNGKIVECAGGKGVIISNIKNGGGYDQILHFSQLPTDPTGYFDPDTMTLHSSISGNDEDIRKVNSLQGMVFMGDSILTSLQGRGKLEQNEGVITMYQSGCRPEFFLGEQNCSGMTGNCSEGGYFNWNKRFSKISNPTGFYLLLGQNSCHDEKNRIKNMDRLIQKIKSSYPSAPIYMSSVLYHIDSDGSDKRYATSMNEELKVYCASQSNVYYSDILRGFNDNLGEMSDDGDHPNKKGTQVLIKNIKENIVGTQSAADNSTTNTQVAPIDDFSNETRQIIMSHINDFNKNNFKDFIEKYPGGYDGYMQSLGGVFAKYGGKGKKIEINNAGDLQEAAEFVWGLMSIWGFDYWNSTTYWSWGQDEEFEGLHNSAYYPGHFYSGGGYSQANINDICSNPDKPMRTNCNAGIDTFLWTTNLDNNGSKGYATKDKSGERIDKKEDLRVGDLVHFYHDSAENDWGHVAIVGEIDQSTGNVILYDTGNRFIRTGRYKIPLGVGSGTNYDGYVKWVGRRYFNIDQTTNRSSSNTNTETQNTVYKVKVATWSEHLDKVESNDPEVNTYDTGIEHNMTTTTIPYQEIVSKYKMPFNYLWTMLVYSQDKDYTFDLADLVKNSKIEITIHDNLNETTNKVTDTYTDYTKIHAEADVKISYQNVSTIQDKVYNPSTGGEDIVTKEILTDSSTTKHGKGDGEKWDPYYVIHTTITKTNTLDIALTLSDAWCAKYEKKYTYNSPKTTESNTSTSLDDISEDPYTNKGELGGQESKVDQDAVEQATYYDRRNVHSTGERENEFATYQTTRITRVKNIYTKTITSSYISTPGKNVDRSSVTVVSTPKTGQLNKDNYVEFAPHTQGDTYNHQQGFCFAGDDLIVYAINHPTNPKTFSIYLVDAKTMQEYDSYHGLKDHGNSIAYDSKTGDIIAPEIGVMKLISINKTTKKFENARTQSLPEYERNTSSIAYNESNDLFISKGNVYTRQAFYSNGKPLRKMKNTPPSSNLNISGCTSFGNQVYYYYTEKDYSKNYFVVCNINSGQQEEVITDNMNREGEEASFTKDGTLYICYGYGRTGNKVTATSFQKTDYNYYADSNIDQSNVSSSNSNDVSQYTTGGEHTENGYFEKVFNSHYNARSNIISVEEWLYDALEQNSDTVNMIDITKYLIARAKGAAEDRETFLAAIEKLAVYEMTQVGTETGGLLSITSTTFTREQFIQLVQSYSAAISKGSGTKDFRDNAGVVYDVCKKNNVNPVLCAAQAWKEQNWVYPSTSKYNYWGIAVYNGQNYGSSYSSMEAAVENYCKNINQRLKGENGAEKWSKICAQYNNKFTGGINNLYDVLSNWACVKNADSNHPGQAEHAALYVDSVIKCATQIFGEGALTASGGGGDFLAVAQNIWKKICNGNYSYGGSSIPCTGSTVDCSSYASWVIYEYGYTDFKGSQRCTQDFKNINWNQKYGWTEINVGGGQNPYDSIQPGDLFVRDPGNNNGHITLVVRKENGKIYCYDCGNAKNWRNNPNAEALDKSYMLTDSRPGKIIRVTPKR